MMDDSTSTGPLPDDSLQIDSATVDSATTEELTAYLDGELDHEAALRVEQRLSVDADYRLQMQRLQRTWDLLDVLPEGHVDDQFTRTTMEMVVQEAVGRSADPSLGWLTSSWLKWLLRTVAIACLPLASFAICFAAVRHYQAAPIKQFVENLPTIENSDHYLMVDLDLDFLENLEQSGLFSDESALYSRENDVLAPEPPLNRSTDNSNVNPTFEQKQKRLDLLDSDQRKLLIGQRGRFQELSAEEQQNLIGFHDKFLKHPRTDSLDDVLSQYYNWLGTLNLDERASLTDLPAQERVAKIEQLKTRQARREFGRTGATRLPYAVDAEAVFDWYELVSMSNANQIRQQFVNLVLVENMDAGRSITQKKMNRLIQRPLNQLIAVLIRFDRTFIEDLLYRNFYLLQPALSADAREILQQQTAVNQKKLLLRWIMAANQSRSTITEEQLQSFYEELPATDRDDIDRMADWASELTRRYRATQLSDSSADTVLPDDEQWQSLLQATGLLSTE